MKKSSVSSKIKILGALLLGSIFLVIFVSIYLNEKNVKDALIVNIAGKQRMLTQKISKNIFYLYETRASNFSEMDNAIVEFNYNLNTLKDGNTLLNISAAPTQKINEQISKVIVLWKTFENNVKDFKIAIIKNDVQTLNSIFSYINETNNLLLENVDEVVNLYTNHIEEKTKLIKNFQYLSFTFLTIFAIYSFIQLRQIELHAKEFIDKYKKFKSSTLEEIEPIHIESEKEFVEVADSINCFLDKVTLAMNYSNGALEQSKMASQKLQDLTLEFGNIINELENKKDIIKELDKSEDIAIESSESLLKTTNKLNDLKIQLDNLLKNCKK